MSTTTKSLVSPKTSKVTKKATTKKVRNLLGKKVSEKLPIEVKATLNIIEKNLDKGFIPFDVLFGQFQTELKRLGSNSKSNLKTRFRRSIYRTIEPAILKGSIQAVKFNLSSQVKGLVIAPKTPFQYKSNGDVLTKTVDNNSFKFSVKGKIEKRKELNLTKTLEKKVDSFKKKFISF